MIQLILNFIQFIGRALENVDSLKAFVISISSAIFGSALSVDTKEIAAQVADPIWFCNIKPYFQIGAWSVAMLSGIVGICIALRNDRRKKKQHIIKKK